MRQEDRRKSILFGCLFGLWFVGCVFRKTGYFRRGRRRILLCVCVDDCAEALWMAVCVLYSVTLSLSFVVVVVTAVALCERRRWLSERKEEINVCSQWGSREGGLSGEGFAILCLSFAERTIVDGWCRSNIGMDDKRSLSVMNVAIDGKLTRTRTGNSTKE